MALAHSDVIEKKSSIDLKTQAFIGGNYTNSLSGKKVLEIGSKDFSDIAYYESTS